jgi:hypothetical protein
MPLRSYGRAAVVAVIAAAIFACCAWHFAWRQAAYWSTGEQITGAELSRAKNLSEVFGCMAAVTGATAIVFWVLYFKARRRGTI